MLWRNPKLLLTSSKFAIQLLKLEATKLLIQSGAKPDLEDDNGVLVAPITMHVS